MRRSRPGLRTSRPSALPTSAGWAVGEADRLLACRVDALVPPGRPLTPEDVDRVAAIADPVIRNLQITQAYHELSAAAAARLGQVANWCTFATWASKQAGRTIRKEDLQRSLEAAFRSSPTAASAAREVTTQASRFGATIPVGESLASVWRVVDPAAALDRASAAVARGNLRVFEEIGREFARFEVECGPDATIDADTLARFIEGLEPGEPPGRAALPAPGVLSLPSGALRSRSGNARAARPARQPRDRLP